MNITIINKQYAGFLAGRTKTKKITRILFETSPKTSSFRSVNKEYVDLLDLLGSVSNLTNLTNQYSLISTDSKCSKTTRNVQNRLQMFKTEVSLNLFHNNTEMTA